MTPIEDFTKNELWVIEETLAERYTDKVETDQGEAELRLDPHATELVPCPVIFWVDSGYNFVVAKIGDRRYRAQFFLRVHQQFGTGIDEFSDISECVVTLLQVQSDHQAKRDAQAKAKAEAEQK